MKLGLNQDLEVRREQEKVESRAEGEIRFESRSGIEKGTRTSGIKI